MGTLFETGVRPAIDAWLLEESKKVRSYGDYWSASSAGYCYRKLIFERLGVPEVKQDPRKQRVFTSGHIFHNWIQELTREAGLSIAQELELQDEELMIRGHIDDLVLIERDAQPGDIVTGAQMNKSLADLANEPPSPSGITIGKPPRVQHLILYDYKTRNSRSFNYAKEPMHTHKMQLGTYMYMLRKTEPTLERTVRTPSLEKQQTEIRALVKDLTEARTLNIEKDTLRMAEVQYIWNPELEKAVKDYWEGLNKLWKERKMPPCTCESFMQSEKYNPYFYDGEPCSLKWYKLWKEKNETM